MAAAWCRVNEPSSHRAARLRTCLGRLCPSLVKITGYIVHDFRTHIATSASGPPPRRPPLISARSRRFRPSGVARSRGSAAGRGDCGVPRTRATAESGGKANPGAGRKPEPVGSTGRVGARVGWEGAVGSRSRGGELCFSSVAQAAERQLSARDRPAGHRHMRAPLRLRPSCGLARPRGQPLPPLCVPTASTCTETSAQARRAHTRRPDNPLATPGVALIWLSSFRPPATSRHRTCPPEARCSARPSQLSASIQGSI